MKRQNPNKPQQPFMEGESQPERIEEQVPDVQTPAVAPESRPGGLAAESTSTVDESPGSNEGSAPDVSAAGRPGSEDVPPAAAVGPEGPDAGSSQQPKGSRLPLILSIVALLAAGLTGWQVYELRMQNREVRQEVAQRLSGGETATAELRGLSRQHQESIAALQAKFGALEAQVAQTEGQAAALEALYLEYSRSRSDQALAEVEQAISIAAQQLQLAGNFEAALIALQSAEARLASPDQGHLQALRRALISDIEGVKAHPQVDVPGLALRLEILLDRVDALPLAFEVALAQAAAEREKDGSGVTEGEGDLVARSIGFAKALAEDIWGEIRTMVRLERLDQADPVLLAPAQATYLRENVKIRLLTARLALLARDGRTFADDLEKARDWIGRYFDREDDAVKRSLAELEALQKIQIRVEAPSLRDTFAALRLVQARASAGSVRERTGDPATDGAR